MTGFFSTVSRYARPALVREDENRLSQIFAGVLEHCPDLALALAQAWCKPDRRDSHVGAELDDVACASTRFCVAIDGDGRALTYR